MKLDLWGEFGNVRLPFPELARCSQLQSLSLSSFVKTKGDQALSLAQAVGSMLHLTKQSIVGVVDHDALCKLVEAASKLPGLRAFDMRGRGDLDDDQFASPVSYTHLTLPTTPYV